MDGILETEVIRSSGGDGKGEDCLPETDGSHRNCRRTYPIATLVTDIENILVDVRPWESWLTSQLQVAESAYEQVLARWHRSELLRCANAGMIPIWDAWYDFLLTVGASPGWAEELVIGIRCRYESAFARCRLHPDIVSVFREIQDVGIRLAVFGDNHWRQSELDEVLRQLRLPVEICCASTTALLGASGPDPKRFVEFLKRLEVPATSVAYLGWNRRTLESARRANMVSVLFNGTPQTPADIAVVDLRELPRHFVPWDGPHQQRAA
ncbi:MAG: HAD family hydrolase [Planctomycetota bacterium]|nr:HAD family hydrolase [Planctomycetota bacterium]